MPDRHAFAPTKVAWSLDNRTVGFRFCGEGSDAVRVEYRIDGADLIRISLLRP
nr:hypothetical protein [Paraburkholderia sp. BL8N3]